MSRVGSGRISRIESGSGQEVMKSRGSGQVKKYENVAVRVGSGQEVLKSRGSVRVGSRGLKSSRVGSDPRDTGHSRVKPP